MRLHLLVLSLVVVVMTGSFIGCNCGPGPSETDAGTDSGHPGGGDGGGDVDSGLPEDAGGGDTDAGVTDAGVNPDSGTPDAGPHVCQVAKCVNQVYACGNCLDDDGDGLIDSEDPDCLGPCHNQEQGFFLSIPGGSGGTCNSTDCYYDSNSGRGNDSCVYNPSCDPLAPVPGCPYSGLKVGETADCPATQVSQCLTTCKAITPNGCDCFGCCTVQTPDGGSRDIYLGSTPDSDACNLQTAGDPNLCKACTKNTSCDKGCGTCQLCLGKTELPPECFGDGGVVTLPDGGVLDGGSLQCPGGEQPCGLTGQAACPSNYFCLTGCCVVVIN